MSRHHGVGSHTEGCLRRCGRHRQRRRQRRRRLHPERLVHDDRRRGQEHVPQRPDRRRRQGLASRADGVGSADSIRRQRRRRGARDARLPRSGGCRRPPRGSGDRDGQRRHDAVQQLPRFRRAQLHGGGHRAPLGRLLLQSAPHHTRHRFGPGHTCHARHGSCSRSESERLLQRLGGGQASGKLGEREGGGVRIDAGNTNNFYALSLEGSRRPESRSRTRGRTTSRQTAIASTARSSRPWGAPTPSGPTFRRSTTSTRRQSSSVATPLTRSRRSGTPTRWDWHWNGATKTKLHIDAGGWVRPERVVRTGTASWRRRAGRQVPGRVGLP